MGFVGIETSLRASQRAIVLLPILLDDAFHGTVGHIRITGPKQKQVRQHARESAIPILKGMDGEKSHHKDGNDEQRMMGFSFQFLVRPGDEFLHQPRSVGWLGSLKNDSNTPAMLVERLDIVRDVLVVSAMMLVAR